MKFDCLFIGMKFLEEEIPKEKKFLLKYFKGKQQKIFLRYVIFFGNYENFCDHTGIIFEEKWLKKLLKKYVDLIYTYMYIKNKIDIESLSKIDNGKIKIYDKTKANYKIKEYI